MSLQLYGEMRGKRAREQSRRDEDRYIQNWGPTKTNEEPRVVLTET